MTFLTLLTVFFSLTTLVSLIAGLSILFFTSLSLAAVSAALLFLALLFSFFQTSDNR
jgi:hypothetical protein